MKTTYFTTLSGRVLAFQIMDGKQYRGIDGFLAGVKIIKFKPDLIILDLFMPQIDGFKVCQQIREEPETSGIKIISISGYGTKENKIKRLNAAANVVLPKPIDKTTILNEIQQLI